MKKRICSLLIVFSMIAALWPQITLPQAAAADGTTTANSKTDAFGLPTEIDDSLKTNDLSKNPYGTKGWIPLFQNHELVVAGVDSDEFQTTYKGNAGGKGSEMSSFRWSNSTAVGNAKRIATVAFDPNGTGRDEYIANLVFDASAKELRLYVTNKDRRVSNVVRFGEDSKFIKELKFYQTRSMLCLTAGDFNGNGKDTLMVYTPGNNGSEETVDSIREYQLVGSKLSETGSKINLGDVLNQGKAGLKEMLYHNGNGTNELRAHLSVDMEAGDVDLDGIEELAMTVNVNELKKDSYGGHDDFERSYLTVYEGDNGNWSQKMKRELVSQDGGAKGRARFAGVTIGNFSSAPSDGVAPEVIAVGFYETKGDYHTCKVDSGKLLLYSYQYQTNGDWTEKYKAQELSANGFTNTGTKDDEIQNPVAVAAVSADGAMTKEYLFVSGSMYKVGDAGIERCDGSDMGKNRGIGGYIINNTGILDYAVGNFDGNKQGREQVYYVEYHKQETFDKQFLRIGQLYKTASDFSRFTENDWTYYAKGNCGLAVTAADVNNDAVLARINKISYGYTDPKVMAILEASPHFSELDSFGNSATSIGKSTSTETEVHASGSFGIDVMAGFEYVAPIIETGGGIEFNTSHTFTVGGGSSTAKTVSIAYSNDNEEENAVVMYATPMTYYLYDVKYPDGTPQKESTMMLAVPMNPVTSIVSVDTYNEAAAAYADMDQIGANVQLGTPGQPNTYRSGQPKAGDKNSWKYGEWKQYYGTGTITESFEKADSTSVSFDYEYEGSVQAYGIAGGFKAGGGVHWGVSTGTEKVSTNSLTKEGAVNCQNDPRYNFNWQFATWTVSLNGDDVPVLGYMVDNVAAPPSPAENLRLSEQTTDSMVLSWDSGARPAEYYKIYRYIENNKDDPFILVDTVDASEAASGSYEYTLTGLAANTEYKYAITSGYYTGNNESVESEIVAGKTLASDMERPTITGPNKDVRAPLGESATFSVSVSGPAVYKSFKYRWQKREVGGKWENISGATSNTYTVDKVTSELNGAMFRCVVTGLTSSSDPIPFYSDAAMLTVGMPTADAALDVAGHKTGSGTKENPYIGQSDYLSIGKGAAVTETKTTSYTATAADGTKLAVYKVNDQNAYIGIGTDTSGNTVYYSVTANADGTFAAGAKLDESTVYTWKKDGTDLTVPGGTSPDTALTTTLGSGEQETIYYQAVVLDDATHKPTDYLYLDGEIYTMSGTKATGMDNVKPYLVHSKTDSQYILSQTVTTGTGEDEDEKKVTSYYELTITTTPAAAGGTATTTYALSNALTYTAEHKIGTYTNPSFTLHQTETKETVIPETREAGTGTALSLTTTTKNTSNNNAPLSVDYTLTITNTSTGTVSTLTGRTDANGKDTKQWRAPIAGLYAITTTTAGGTADEPKYYLAGVQTVRNTEESETVYTLDSAISGVYGSPVALTTRQQTIKKTGDTISAEASSVVDGVTYKYRLSSSAATETEINGASFDAPKAGTYVVSAYKNGEKLASTTINIKRKPVTLSITLPGDTAGDPTYDAPAHKSDITFTGKDELKSSDTLPNDAILINCDLYDSDGNKRDISGRFEITLSLNNGDNASTATKQTIADLLEKYEFTFVSRKVISEQQTGTVAYSAGEGGTVVARKGAGGSIFVSGAAVAYGAEVTFDAYPAAGHMVKEWLVNGAAVSGNNYEISADRTRLTVKSFSGSDLVDGKLTVEVKFGSDSHKITFSAGDGGSLTAALADGSALTNEQNVPEGSTVTFTAAPSGSKGVQSWTVDGKPYCWPGTTKLYRETTLTLENISDDRTVQVAFTDGDAATHTITTGYTTEQSETVTGVSISAKLASGADIDLTNEKVQDGAAVTFTVNGLNSNHTVKEWLVDGQTATGSGGQTSFTLRDITGNHTVTAVIAVATAHTLTFRAVDADGNEITDENIAKLTATSRGTPIESGWKIAAYTPIDFNVAVGENYYVKLKIAIRPGMKLETEEDGWSDNVTVAPEDIHKATLTDWNADTLVTVTVKEKPVVTFNDGANGKLAVKYSHDGQEYTLDASSENHHVEYGERIYVTATPNDGYYVASIVIAGSEHGTMASSTLEGRDPGAVTRETTGLLNQDGLTVSATYAKKPVVTFAGDDHITVTAKQGDTELTTGNWVEKFSGDIVFTATPEKGYETAGWNGLTYSAVDNAANDNTTYTKQGEITSDVTVSVTAKEIPQHRLTLSVRELGGGVNGGTVLANITRKALSDYNGTITESGDFYRDSNIAIVPHPEDGYRVQSYTWNVNGTTGSGETIPENLLKNVQGDVQIVVSYVKLGSGISFGPLEGALGSENGYISAANLTEGDQHSIMGQADGIQITAGGIDFEAAPAAGYEVKGWYKTTGSEDVRIDSFDDAEDKSQFTFTPGSGDTTAYIHPEFRQVEYDITTANDVTVSPSLTNGKARGGTELTFTAPRKAGQNVTGWTINDAAVTTGMTGNTLTWTVENGHLSDPAVTSYDVQPTYENGTYTVHYDQPQNGKLTATAENDIQVAGNTQVTFTAVPDAHYEVDKWTVNGANSTETGNELSLNITDNTSVAVSFKLKTYSVTLNQTEGGTATASPDETTATALETVTFTATPDTGWHFAGWKVVGSDPGSDVSNPLTLSITGNTTVEPVFTKQMVGITAALAAGSKAGTIAMTTGGAVVPADGKVPYGTTVTVTVTPANASDMVESWIVNNVVRSQMTADADAPLSYDVTVTEDTNVVVGLIDKPKYKVTISATGNGTANIGGASEVMVGRGDSITATAAANNGSNYLKNWLVNGTETPKNGDTLTVGPIRQETTIVAVFDELVRQKVMFADVTEMKDSASTVAITADGNTITPGATANDAALVVGNSKVVFKAAVPADEMVGEWTINNVKQDNLSGTLTIDDLRVDTRVTVKFVPYEGYNIPTSRAGYEVTNVIRTPDDTEPATQIRAGGTVEFVVKASDAGKSISEIELNDCGDVTTTPQTDGSIKVTVKNVKANIRLTTVTVVSSIPLRITTPSNGTITVKKGSTVLKNGDKVMEADELTITATPNSNYALDTLTVTGAEKQPNGAYKVKTGVTEVTVAATFKSTGGGNTGGGGGGGGGGVVAASYNIVIPSGLKDTVKSDKAKASEGETVTLTVSGDAAPVLSAKNGKTITLTDLGGGKFRFKMPASEVTVSLKTSGETKPCDGGASCPTHPYTDVDTAQWYHASVDYVLTNGIMNGTSATTFVPNGQLTRGMLVQILYNLEGKPQGGAAAFDDVASDAWYAKAVGWASANKIVGGYGDGRFGPNDAVTREQTAAILYRYAQSKGVDVSVGEDTNILSFTDAQSISEYAIPAMQWAVGAGVLTGKGGGRLDPTGTATRAEIAAIMQRCCEGIFAK